MHVRTVSSAPILFALVVASACVTRKDYDALQGRLDATQQELTDARAKEVSLSEALQTEEESAAALAQEVAALQAEQQSAQAELDRLNGLLAQTSAELSEIVKSRSRLAASVQEMKSALATLNARKLEADKRVAEFRRMLLQFKTLIDAGTLDVRIVDGRMTLVLPMDVLFASGSARLSQAGTQALMSVGEVLATIVDKNFQVEGHTDNVPIHTNTYPSNWELASARALVVVRTLQEAGVAAGHLSAASFADNKPTASNDTEEGRAKNRRIEIVVVPDLSGLPGFDELNEISNGGG